MHVVNAAVLEDWNELSDEQVVADVLAGHTALFELLMRRHNERVYRAARAIVRNDPEAEDLMQQSYVNAYAHLRQFNRQEQFATWLTRIVVNESLARVREKQRYELLDAAQSNAEMVMTHDGSRPLEREAASEDFRALLEPAIDRLPNGLREVFMLSDVEGMSTAEVSRTLKVSEDAVNTRLARARALLHHDLTERTSSFAADAFRFYRPSCNRIVARVLSRIAGA